MPPLGMEARTNFFQTLPQETRKHVTLHQRLTSNPKPPLLVHVNKLSSRWMKRGVRDVKKLHWQSPWKCVTRRRRFWKDRVYTRKLLPRTPQIREHVLGMYKMRFEQFKFQNYGGFYIDLKLKQSVFNIFINENMNKRV